MHFRLCLFHFLLLAFVLTVDLYYYVPLNNQPTNYSLISSSMNQSRKWRRICTIPFVYNSRIIFSSILFHRHFIVAIVIMILLWPVNCTVYFDYTMLVLVLQDNVILLIWTLNCFKQTKLKLFLWKYWWIF